MKRTIIALWVLLAGLATARDNVFSIQLEGGWFNGLSGEAGIAIFNVGGTPIGLRLGLGLSGTAALNQGELSGNLTSNSASNFTLGLDVSYSIDFQSNFTLTPYLGGRLNMFSGSYAGSINGTLSSNQFGAGAGIRLGYFIDSQFSFLADVGADYYFESNYTISGGNFKGGDTFPTQTKTVATIVNEPGLVVKARVGLAFNFQ
jgi:hypothetical protein